MRELQVPLRSHRKEGEAVGRLRFSADGAELLAWVGCTLYAYDLRANESRLLFDDELVPDWEDWGAPPPEVVLSPDGRFVAFEFNFDGDYSTVIFVDLTKATASEQSSATLPTDASGYVGLAFTPDGKELLAVRTVQDSAYGPQAPEIVRFPMQTLINPPKRVEERRNPLTGQTYPFAVRNMRWKRGMELPADDFPSAVALAANGRLVAVGSENGGVHVADLKKKRVFTSFGWEGQKLRDRRVTRVGFDPAGKWVASIAAGRLFARPLGEGKAWRTKDTLGRVNDFAYHPDGRVLCAVFEDGQARYLDPRTGAVRQAFQWQKRPKPLHAVAFAPDGLTCAAGSAKGKVVVWDLEV